MNNETGRPVVVGVDGSEGGRQAVRWAADAASRRNATLRLVHAAEIPMGYRSAGLVDLRALREAMTEQGEAWLAEARELADQTADGLRIERILEVEPAVLTLVSESNNADLLVVGTRGLGGFTSLLVGSTAVELAPRTNCPLVVVRAKGKGAPPPSAGPVVVGVDGTPEGDATIAFAVAEASRHGVELVAVHAWSDLVLETAFATGPAFDLDVLTRDAEETLAERLAGWQERYPDVRITRVVARQRPADALLRAAEQARMVVVGTRGRGGFRGLLLGSTSQHLMHHAPCPVAIVRGTHEVDADRG